MVQLELPTKSKKKRQSIETGGAVAKAVQARRFLSDNAQATAASTLPARETGSVMDRLDSGGKQSTSGTRKVAKAVKKIVTGCKSARSRTEERWCPLRHG